MNYNELQTATVAEHLAERGYIIEEYGRIIEELSNRKADQVLTIYYHDGLNYFEIINN